MVSLAKFEQDADGQWWYHHASGRCRAATLTCPTCNKEFLTYQKSGASPFCSSECRRYICRRCGKPYRPNSTGQQFCSLPCRWGIQTCAECGKEYCVKRSKKYCSQECHYNFIAPVGSLINITGGYKAMKVPKDTPGLRMSSKCQKRWMLEHRYVMQQKLGRVLEPNEHVHHINGVPDDNRPENLELWKGKHPHGVRSADYHCAGCRCFE